MQIGRVVEQSPASIRNDLGRLLLNRGKMLRPAFVLLSARWGKEGDNNVQALASALELLHTASLVHDDVLDNAIYRRGVFTLHKTLGIKKAVLIGDYLLGVSLKLAVQDYDKGVMPIFIDRLNRLLESEIEQDFPENYLNVSKERYLKKTRGKTAELFGLSCMAGAMVSGCEISLSEKLYELGILYGMAFQIDDDILDYTGAAGLLGKKTGQDLKAGILTLPFVEAVLDGDKKALAYIKSPFLRLFPGRMQRAIVRNGYADKAATLSMEYKKKALELLQSLPECSSKSLFQEILQKLLTRKS
jgi:heptaprenyl diphosphate synthase